MIRRALALSTVFVLATAAPAFAHEEINPKTVTVGQPTFLTLTAANEKTQPLTKVVLTAPAGLNFGEAVRSPAGWSANKSDTVITWSGGSVVPGSFEQWGFEIESADQPGTLTYKVTLTAGGDSEDVSVPITAVAGGATSPSTTPATTASTSITTTSTPPTTSTAEVAAAAKDAKDASDKAGTALVLGVIALILGIVALVVAFLRRKPSSPAPTADVEQDF